MSPEGEGGVEFGGGRGGGQGGAGRRCDVGDADHCLVLGVPVEYRI